MKLYPLPADARDVDRLAYANWALTVSTMPLISNGDSVHPDGWNAILESIEQAYAQGDSPVAKQLREHLAFLRRS